MDEVFSKLRVELQNALVEACFERSTEVQRIVIPRGLMGFNVVMQARTGSGKTAAYLLPHNELYGR